MQTSESLPEFAAPLARFKAITDEDRRWDRAMSESTRAFGRPFAILFVGFATALVTLRIYGLVDPRLAIAGSLLSPLIAACCAVPIAWLTERRIEERYRRELLAVQQQRQEAHLRLLVLQAQIEPHFLFNTLASLRALLREDVDQAEGMVDALVDHLRAVLPLSRNEDGVSTLVDQVAICASYLDLMSIRLDGRLSYDIELPDALRDAVFPPLMLLTLVENAVKHGIEPKSGAGYIRIEARRTIAPTDGRIAVSVMDDGVGLSSKTEAGLGLRTLHQQLALRYGDSAALTLSGAPRGGTIALLLVPHERLQAS